MLILDALETRNALSFPALITAVERMFRSNCTMPVRHHHDVHVPGEPDGTLLLMPAWEKGRYLGVKLVTVFPGNATRSLPSIYGTYLLSSAVTGELLALLDGGELTARRTAAASALAARYLAPTNAKTMLMVGTGRLSTNLIEAHSIVRPLETILIWGRDKSKANETARSVEHLGLKIETVDNLQAAAGRADLISCATLSNDPLIFGDWLKPGTHLDLVGAFKPSMRESDDTATKRADVYVDTRAGAMSEAGDIVQPLKSGALTEDQIKGDLFDLVSGRAAGRTDDMAITLFKSVGAALEDLAGAVLAMETVQQRANGAD